MIQAKIKRSVTNCSELVQSKNIASITSAYDTIVELMDIMGLDPKQIGDAKTVADKHACAYIGIALINGKLDGCTAPTFADNAISMAENGLRATSKEYRAAIVEDSKFMLNSNRYNTVYDFLKNKTPETCENALVAIREIIQAQAVLVSQNEMVAIKYSTVAQWMEIEDFCTSLKEPISDPDSDDT